MDILKISINIESTPSNKNSNDSSNEVHSIKITKAQIDEETDCNQPTVFTSQIITVPYYHDNPLVHFFFREDESTIKEITYIPKDPAPIGSTKDV